MPRTAGARRNRGIPGPRCLDPAVSALTRCDCTNRRPSSRCLRMACFAASPVPPRCLESHKHVPIRAEGQAVFGNRRPQHIPAQPLERAPVLCADGDVHMKIEAGDPRSSAMLWQPGNEASPPAPERRPIERECAKVHVRIWCAAQALDDGDRAGASATVTRCLRSISPGAQQCTHVDREHGAAERVIPGKPMAKLEGKAESPQSRAQVRCSERIAETRASRTRGAARVGSNGAPPATKKRPFRGPIGR